MAFREFITEVHFEAKAQKQFLSGTTIIHDFNVLMLLYFPILKAWDLKVFNSMNHCTLEFHFCVLSLCLFLPRLVLEFSLIFYAFGKFPIVIWTWCAMFLCTLSLPYFLFQHWARGYSKSSHPVIRSLFHGLLFMVFQIGVLGFGPTYVVLAYTLPPASRGIVIFEQVTF